MTYEEAQAKVFSVLTATGVVAAGHIMPENDNSPRPSASAVYLTYDFIMTPDGTPIYTDPDNAGVRTIKQRYILETDINAYNTGARTALKTLWEKLKTDTIKLLLIENGLGLFLNPVFQDLTELQDSKFQERGLLQFSMHAINEQTETISYIDTAEITYDI